jgi:N-acetylglucosaminyl-diphospho-decaprenol L-rhamnosyltransferase
MSATPVHTGSGASMGRRLSALVVNYRSGAFAVGCVQSLIREWEREGRDRADLEVVVVDNASPTDETAFLAELEGLGARVVLSDVNGGYAGGMNLAYAETSGGPEDVVAILNPDLCFLPGSIQGLMDWLAEHPECGAVDPKASVDPEGAFLLPPNALPTPGEHAFSIAAQLHPALCRAFSRRRVRFAHPWWLAEHPLEAEMLSGCCMFARREVVDRLPALMDERYPLYYEDADFCRSIRALGYTLVHHNGVHVLHHWSRSSGVGELFQGDPLTRYHKSQAAYFEKFYGPLGRGLVNGANWLAAKWPPAKSFRPMQSVLDLGPFPSDSGGGETVEIELPRSCNWIIELALAPTWILAVGIHGTGDRWVCTPGMWEWLFQGDYFLRALDRDTGEQLGAWHFAKVVPGRNHPLSGEELEALQREEVPA